MTVDEIDEFVDRITELIDAVVYDNEHCSCCSTPQSWDAKAKLAEFLNQVEKSK